MKISLKGILFIVGAVAVLALVGNMIFGRPSGDITLKERIFWSITDTLDVEVNGEDQGSVSEHIFQVTRHLTWTDGSGNKRATGSIAIISIGTDINVVDGSGNPVGSIQERIFSRWGKTWSGYNITDASGKVIASSDKSEWMGTRITITANDGTKVAVLDRPWLNPISDTWAIKVLKKGAIDERMLVMIAAFKTIADNDKKPESSKKDTGSKK